MLESSVDEELRFSDINSAVQKILGCKPVHCSASGAGQSKFYVKHGGSFQTGNIKKKGRGVNIR
jgi:hypothetical protein